MNSNTVLKSKEPWWLLKCSTICILRDTRHFLKIIWTKRILEEFCNKTKNSKSTHIPTTLIPAQYLTICISNSAHLQHFKLPKLHQFCLSFYIGLHTTCQYQYDYFQSWFNLFGIFNPHLWWLPLRPMAVRDCHRILCHNHALLHLVGDIPAPLVPLVPTLSATPGYFWKNHF